MAASDWATTGSLVVAFFYLIVGIGALLYSIHARRSDTPAPTSSADVYS